MPNHCFQRLEVHGDSPERVRQLVETEDCAFDINTFFPMPEELKFTRSPALVVDDEEYEKEKDYPEWDDWRKAGIGAPISRSMATEYLKRFNANNWYEWALQNWGTKWGVYEVQEWEETATILSIQFWTAWRNGGDIICKLSEHFPDLYFELSFLNEDRDDGGGILYIKDGTVGEDTLDYRDAYEAVYGCAPPEDEE